MGISSPLVTSQDPKSITAGTKTGARSAASSSKATSGSPGHSPTAAPQDSKFAGRPLPPTQANRRKSVPSTAPPGSQSSQSKPLGLSRPLPWLQASISRAVEAEPATSSPLNDIDTARPSSSSFQDARRLRRGVQRLRGDEQPLERRRLQWSGLQRRGSGLHDGDDGRLLFLQRFSTQAAQGDEIRHRDTGASEEIQGTSAEEVPQQVATNSLQEGQDARGPRAGRQSTPPTSTGGDGTSSSGERSRAPSITSRRPIDSAGSPDSGTRVVHQSTGGPTVGSRRSSANSRRSENDDVRTRSATSDDDAGRGGPRGSRPSPATLGNIHYWRSPRTNQAPSVLPITSPQLLERSPPSRTPSPKSGQPDTRSTVDQTFDRFASKLPAGGHVRQQTQKFEEQSKAVPEEFQVGTGSQAEGKQGQLQPKRVRSPGPAISRAIQGLEKVASKAKAEVEGVDNVQRIDPAAIPYWQTKRARSPNAWHELLTLAAEAGRDLRQLEAALVATVDDSTPSPVHPVDPTTLAYTRSKRVTDPHGYWQGALAAVDSVANNALESVQGTTALFEEALPPIEQSSDPTTIAYHKSKRVWEPGTYWKEAGAAVEHIKQDIATTAETLASPVATFAEDAIDTPQLNIPPASYWTSGRIRKAQGPRPLEALPTVPAFLPTANEHSLSEYSGEVSDDPKSPSARPRKSLSEASSRLPSLWQTSRQLVGTSTDAGDAEVRRRSKQLSKAADNLNALMDNAITMAKRAAENGRPDEAADILRHASQTLRHASTLPKVSAHAKESSASDLEILWRPPTTLTSTDPASKDFAYAQSVRRRGRARTDDPTEMHHLGLPITLRTSSLTQTPRPLVTRVSNLADGRRRSSVISPTTMVMQGSPDETTSSSSPSKDGPKASTTDPAAHFDLLNPRRRHVSLPPGQGFSLGRHHVRPPIAREWQTGRKRITAVIACMNTVFIGLIAGIYAGEVPRIQYQIADTKHVVIYGNVLLFMGVGISSLIFWPLPLLHGRKPYTLAAFALMLPLQFPQALAIQGYSDPHSLLARFGLLLPRILTGLALGFANINLLPTLLDLFGASLQSERPHQELVVEDDVRRQGGGIGLWLGVWTWCYIGSLSVGFCIGACIISTLDPAWGFYLVIILLAFFLFINVVAPETRPSPYRRSLIHFFDTDEKIHRRVARGEVKLHISNDGPKWWWEEVWAGLVLTKRMVFQPGFAVMALYLAWIYAQVVFVIILLGALLSRDYVWQAWLVGLASLSFAFGALLAIPLSHANWFSRARWTPQRTDSMTFHHTHYVWTSHMVRRCIFTLTLPLAALAYTVSSQGVSVSAGVPIAFVGLVGFLSNLAITECVGIIMETFDTSDLQPGANSKHRLNSLPTLQRRRRTNYSSYPRICAGFFFAQSLGFFLAAAATGVSGKLTRALGAQISTAIGAAVLLNLTIGLLVVLWRWKSVQVVPDGVLVNLRGETGTGAMLTGSGGTATTSGDWKPVLIGHPTGKMRRMSFLECGRWTRWREIRRLNKLE